MTATASINRGGYWWPDVPWSGNVADITANIPVSSTGIPALADANDVRRNDTTSTATLGPQLLIYRRPIRWTWTADMTRFQTIGGKNNEIKVGFTWWWTKQYVTNFGYPNQQVYNYTSLASEDYVNNCPTVTPTCMLQVFQHPNNVQISNYPNTTQSGFGYRALYFNDKINLTRKFTLTGGVRMDYYNSFLPAQGQKGLGPQPYIPNGSNSPLNGVSGTQAPDFTTAISYPSIDASHFPTYTRFVPRFSAAYDLRGDGRIALKASYGRYTAYTSGIGSDLLDASTVGPNSSTSTCTYKGWTGDIPFTPKPGNYTSASCSGGLQTLPGQVGPNGAVFSVSDPTTWPIRFANGLSSDYLDEFTAGADVGLSRDYSLRFSVVRKFDEPKSKIIDEAQPFSSYTDERCYNYNALANTVTAAASNNLVPSGNINSGVACVWSVPTSFAGQGRVNQLISPTRAGEGQADYTSFEFAFNKQLSNGWSFLMGYDGQMHHRNPMDPIDPNELYYQADNRLLGSSYAFYGRAWDHAVHINGSYALPYGFIWSSNFLSQSGAWFNRAVNVKNALGTTVTLNLGNLIGRYPWENVWDQRFTKRVKIGDRNSVDFYYEVFNTLNSNAITGWGTTIGQGTSLVNNPSADGRVLYKPTSILSPRISQISVKYHF